MSRVSAKLNFNICKEIGVRLDKEHWYKHVPKLVKTSLESKVSILWNEQLQTDRTIPYSKPVITMRDSTKRDCVNRCCSVRRLQCD